MAGGFEGGWVEVEVGSRWDLGTWTAGSGFQKIALMDSILGGLVFRGGGPSVYV